MDGFFSWFFTFITQMIRGIWNGILGFFKGFWAILNIPGYIKLLNEYKAGFTVLDWVLSILGFIIVYAFWIVIIGLIVYSIRKYILFRKSLSANEDLLMEISNLHHDIEVLTKEKERILDLQLGPNASAKEIMEQIQLEKDQANEEEEKEIQEEIEKGNLVDTRFNRLALVDKKYEFYTAPAYVEDMSLEEICDDLRNFACYRSRLFYEIKTIRLMIAGFASTKLVVLQGISGTGKTSLPYIMGKYFTHDTTIASVQPSWRDRSELFGFFNEFTKRFNETEVLKRIYDANYNDDINLIILDEMNIARIEYYFAEMLSILELPDPNEWNIEIVPSAWETDPAKLVDGRLKIPQNVWYVGTANNDDSTFTISDKVYDRAFTINLDSKGVPFEATPTESKNISFSHMDELFHKAWEEHPVSEETLKKLELMDQYVIDHFRVAFGNRITKQIKLFVPAYVACGGTEYEGLDYIIATKIFRKFESLNLGLIRDEIKGLIQYLNANFGDNVMVECIAYLKRLQKMY